MLKQERESENFLFPVFRNKGLFPDRIELYFCLFSASCFFFLIPPESYIFAPHLINRYDAFNSFQRGS